jgi:ABC-type uncharacterized transport system fused permease/ATPase subunit
MGFLPLSLFNIKIRNSLACLRKKIFFSELASEINDPPDTAVSPNAISAASEEIISFHEVDIVTPSQKLLARKLSCNVVQGKSLLLTGIQSLCRQLF